MYSFQFQAVRGVDEAVLALRETPEARLLAGGQTLIASMKLRLARPKLLLDLSGVGSLRHIEDTADGIRIGAMCRHAQVATSAVVRENLPCLADLAGGIGDRMVRTMGTIGGSVANSDPAADYPAAVLGLNARVITSKREIEADRFFTGIYSTVLEPDEVITGFLFPKVPRAAYVKLKSPASRFALVGVMVAELPAGVRVAVTGAAACVFRATELERLLRSDLDPTVLAGAKLAWDEMNDDLHASAEYRAQLVSVAARRAVEAVVQR